MIIPLPINHLSYPKRLSPNNLTYTDYKNIRPYFFHELLLIKNNLPDYIDDLVPTIDTYKDKQTYITNDYVLNSIFFEYCDYYINNKLCSAMLPANPYGPTGIGGRGILSKWGPNIISSPIITTYSLEKNKYEILVIEIKDISNILTLPESSPDIYESLSKLIVNKFKDEVYNILNIQTSDYVYTGYVNDSRNTDHSWIEMCVYHFNLNQYQRTLLINVIDNDLNNDCKLKLIEMSHENVNYNNIHVNNKIFTDYILSNLNLN